MKAIRYTLAAALTVIAAASCQDTIAPEQESGIIINATIENTGTKTVLGEKVDNRYPVLWENKDDISVFDGNNNNQRFRTYVSGNHKSAIFQFQDGSWSAAGTWTETDTYYAIYPGMEGNSTYQFERPEGKNPTLTISSLENGQGSRPGFNKSYSYIYGIGETDPYQNDKSKTVIDMLFKPLTALIKFELTSNDITSVRFLDYEGAALAGSKISVTFNPDGTVSTSIPSDTQKKNIYMHSFTTTESTVDNVTTKTYTPVPLQAGVYYISVIAPTSEIRPRISFATATSARAKKEFTAEEYKAFNLVGENSILLTPGMILDLGKFNSSGRVTE